MAVDDARLRARQELERIGLSMESASYLVDDRPPGGWAALATRDHLRAEIADAKSGLRAEIGAEIRVVSDRVAAVGSQVDALAAALRKEMQDQTRWLTGVLLVALTLSTAIARFA